MTELTHARLLEVLHYDPLTGVFIRKVRTSNSVKIGDVAGSPNDQGYILIWIDGERYRASRLAWFYQTGSWPQGNIDHEDGIRGRNVWTNLRDGSQGFNLENQRHAKKHSKTGLLGVSENPSGLSFYARIKVSGVKKHLGTFPTAQLAHAAYLGAKRTLHAGNTL